MERGLVTMGSAKGQELLTALVKQEPGWLDRPIEDIVMMVDIGNVWLQAQRAILKKMPRGNDAVTSAYFKSKLETVRNADRGWFGAVIHLGEELLAKGEGRGGDRKSSGRNQNVARDTLIGLAGIGISTGWKYRKIAQNPDAVEVAFNDAAKKNDGVPGVRTIMEVLGYSPGGGLKPGRTMGQPTADKMAKRLANELREINMVLARLVEHLDQVKPENAKALHEALQRTVEIWVKKAPAEFRKLARGIA
jgi:hypothetical protein